MPILYILHNSHEMFCSFSPLKFVALVNFAAIWAETEKKCPAEAQDTAKNFIQLFLSDIKAVFPIPVSEVQDRAQDGVFLLFRHIQRLPVSRHDILQIFPVVIGHLERPCP